MGLEPTRSCDHRHLKPARLPIPPFLHFFNRLASLYFAPLVDCSLIITQELDNVNRKIQKKYFELVLYIFFAYSVEK